MYTVVVIYVLNVILYVECLNTITYAMWLYLIKK